MLVFASDHNGNISESLRPAHVVGTQCSDHFHSPRFSPFPNGGTFTITVMNIFRVFRVGRGRSLVEIEAGESVALKDLRFEARCSILPKFGTFEEWNEIQ